MTTSEAVTTRESFGDSDGPTEPNWLLTRFEELPDFLGAQATIETATSGYITVELTRTAHAYKNALLLAGARDMYDALKTLLQLDEEMNERGVSDDEYQAALAAARAAITKAETGAA